MSTYVAPAFYNVEEFAEMLGVTNDHIRHAAKNFNFPGVARNRAKLPEGYGAVLWAGVYIIYSLTDADAVSKLFNVKAKAG